MFHLEASKHRTLYLILNLLEHTETELQWCTAALQHCIIGCDVLVRLTNINIFSTKKITPTQQINGIWKTVPPVRHNFIKWLLNLSIVIFYLIFLCETENPNQCRLVIFSGQPGRLSRLVWHKEVHVRSHASGGWSVITSRIRGGEMIFNNVTTKTNIAMWDCCVGCVKTCINLISTFRTYR